MITKDYSQRSKDSKTSVGRDHALTSGNTNSALGSFFTLVTRMMLATIVFLSICVFVVLWWVLPRYLKVEQEQLVMVSTDSQLFFVHVQQDRPAEVFSISDELHEKLVSDPEYAASPRYFSSTLGIIVDSVVELPDVSRDQFHDRWSRLEYLLSHAPSLIFSQEYKTALHMHIGMNKNGVVSELSTVPEIKTLAKINPSLDKVTAYGCPVAVVNATGQSGLAGKFARLLETTGAVVVRVDDQDEMLDHSQLVLDGSTESCLQLESKITILFKQQPTVITDQKLTSKYRSAVVILVGSDVQIEEIE